MKPIHNLLPGELLETPRLWLKMLTPETVTQLYTTFTDAEIMEFMGMGSVEELEKEREKFTQGLTMYRISFRHFLMIVKDSGEVIGKIGYHYWYVPHSRAEIGYALNAENHKRKGYMTEAIEAVVWHGFEAMALNRVEAFIEPGNAASIALVTRLGFSYEGLIRQHYCSNGVISDSACYSLLKSEFGNP